MQVLTESCVIADMRPLVLPFVKTKIKPADAVEMTRQRIVTALSEGKVSAGRGSWPGAAPHWMAAVVL